MFPGADDPHAVPGDAEGESDAPESVLCPHCAATNLSAADFCHRCGAPLSVIATTDPLRSTISEGFLYREATQGTPKLIVVVGIWLIFLPGIASLPIAWVNGAAGRTGSEEPGIWALTSGFGSLASLVIPLLTTMNFVRKRRELRTGDDAPPSPEPGDGSPIRGS